MPTENNPGSRAGENPSGWDGCRRVRAEEMEDSLEKRVCKNSLQHCKAGKNGASCETRHLPAIKPHAIVSVWSSWTSLPGLSACSSILSVGFQGRTRKELGIAVLTLRPTSGIALMEGEGKWLLKEDSCAGPRSLFSHLFLQNEGT